MAHQQTMSPPPPPPPMPQDTTQETAGQLAIDMVTTNVIKPQMKMRTLNWRRIPKRKVLCQQVVNNTPDQHTSMASISEEIDDEEDKNLWFLIAKANKSLKEVRAPNSSSSSTNSKSASKIREMLESVRRRMAAVTAGTEHQLADQSPSQTNKRVSNILEMMDFEDLENLFCLNSQPLGESQLDSDSPNFIRRLSMRTNASSDSVISANSYSNDSSNNGDDDDSLLEIDNILDPKKSLNVNIFLKQVKNSYELIEQINRDEYSEIGKERLENLLKLMPDEQEERRLLKFVPGNRRHRLPVAERFLLQLISQVANLKLRIKFMLLQEEHSTDLEAIGPELDKIDAAANEIRRSQMLRDILNLVLITGNFLNTGGYAADAAGFSLDCLERLSEVRSNKPGVYLIHYLAEMANKLNLTDFMAKELAHVECASRVCMESIKLQLSSMLDKIGDLKRETDKEAEINSDDQTDKLYLLNLLRTLENIRGNVEFLKQRTAADLEATRKQLANYLCEDPDTFKLSECFHNIVTFSQKLKAASEDNERQRRAAKSKANGSFCNLKRSNTINPRLMKAGQGRHSMGNLNSKQSICFSYLTPGNSGKHSSFVDEKANLSRTTSTINVCDNLKEFDDLHEGLMKMLDDTTTRRRSTDSQARYKSNPFGTYRRASKLFK